MGMMLARLYFTNLADSDEREKKEICVWVGFKIFYKNTSGFRAGSGRVCGSHQNNGVKAS